MVMQNQPNRTPIGAPPGDVEQIAHASTEDPNYRFTQIVARSMMSLFALRDLIERGQ
jgi:hypothetical protein